MRTSIKLILFILCLIPTTAHSATVYLDADCSNGTTTYNPVANDCTSGSSRSYTTINNANTGIVAGDTVEIRGGTYSWEQQTITKDNTTWKPYNGETVILDGLNTYPTVGDTATAGTYNNLIMVSANNYVIQDLTLQRSRGRGITIWKSNGIVTDGTATTTMTGGLLKNVVIDSCYRECLVVYYVDGATFEDCVFARGCNGFATVCNYTRAGCIWGDTANVSTPMSNNLTFTRCVVRDGHNEGFHAERYSTGVIFQDGQVYGNNKTNIYCVSNRNSIIRRNLVYGVSRNLNNEVATDASGIWLSSETGWTSSTHYGGHQVYGNLVANCLYNLWINAQDDTWSPLQNNNTVVNNTFMYPAGAYNINIDNDDGTGHIFENNVVVGAGSTAISKDTNSTTGSFDYNLWSPSPTASVQGAHDPASALPSLAKTSGWNTLTDGSLTMTDGQLLAGERNGLILSNTEWMTDYWGTAPESGVSPYIGMHQLHGYSPPPVVSTDMLLVHYGFDTENVIGTSVFDQSGNNQTATLVGSPVAPVTGHIYEAQTLDGVDDYAYATSPSPWFTNTFTIEAWVYSNSDSGAYRILSKMSGTTGNYGWTMKRAASTDALNFGYSTTGTNWTTLNTSADSFEIDGWHYVVIVGDGANIHAYIDGVENTAGDFPHAETAAIHNSTESFQIGRDGEAGDSLLWHGLIDEVKIYNYARSAVQIAADYVYSPKSAVLVWTMDSISGTTVNDGSVSGTYPGTTYNSPTITTGHLLNALSLNGTNQEVRGPTITGLKDGPFTVEVWFNPTVVNATQHLFGSDLNYYRMAVLSTGYLCGYIYDANGVHTVTGTTAVTAGVEHIAHWVFSGSSATLYLDGVAQGSVVCTNPAADSPIYLGAGNTGWSPRQFFGGWLDEAKIYNYAMASEEIAAKASIAAVDIVDVFGGGSGQTPYAATFGYAFTGAAPGTDGLTCDWDFSYEGGTFNRDYQDVGCVESIVTHLYDTAGTYSVALRINRTGYNSDTLVKTNLVTVADTVTATIAGILPASSTHVTDGTVKVDTSRASTVKCSQTDQAYADMEYTLLPDSSDKLTHELLIDLTPGHIYTLYCRAEADGGTAQTSSTTTSIVLDTSVLYFSSAATSGDGTLNAPYGAFTDFSWTQNSNDPPVADGVVIHLNGHELGTLDFSGTSLTEVTLEGTGEAIVVAPAAAIINAGTWKPRGAISITGGVWKGGIMNNALLWSVTNAWPWTWPHTW